MLGAPRPRRCLKPHTSSSASVSSEDSKLRHVQPWVKNSPDGSREPQMALTGVKVATEPGGTVQAVIRGSGWKTSLYKVQVLLCIHDPTTHQRTGTSWWHPESQVA